MTLSGRPAHFFAGGQQAMMSPSGGNELTYRNVGTDVDCLPVALTNGRVYLELGVKISSVNPDAGLQTAGGFVPGFDECGTKTAVELGTDQAMLMCPGRSNDRITIFVAIAHIFDCSFPAAAKTRSAIEERAAKRAAKLVTKYHEACANAEPEKARRYARQALDLDPECFARGAKSESSNKLLETHAGDARHLKGTWGGPSSIYQDQPSHLAPVRVHGGIE